MVETDGENPFTMLQNIFMTACEKADVFNVLQKSIHCEESSLVIAGNPVSLGAFKRIFVIGAGIAAYQMAYFMENVLKSHLTQGIVLVPPGSGGKLQTIQVREVTSPLVDQASRKAVMDLLYMADNAQEADLVIVLLSKGAGEMMELLHEDVSYNDYVVLLKNLKSHNAETEEVNALKTHTSIVKGGQLLRFINPATSVSLILSDQPGGNSENTFLAPTSYDSTTFHYCRQILLRYKITLKLPPNLLNHFNRGIQGKVQETVKPGDPLLSRAHNFVIHDCSALGADALQAARERRLPATILSTRFKGDPQQIGQFYGSILRDIAELGIPLEPPCILVGSGRISGSDEERLRNCATLALTAAKEISGISNAYFLTASSFQFEKNGPVGCMVNGETIPGLKVAGLDPIDVFLQNKELHVLSRLDLLVNGKFQVNDCGDLFILAVM